MSKSSKPLRIGTDCSGIEAPIQALENLKVNFRHIFSSEIDSFARQSIKENYNPDILYEDMMLRDDNNLKNIDIYVCGFPCQPFSYAGKREGVYDTRGTIFWKCLNVIKTKKPKFFILENVPGILTSENGETWKTIKEELKSLESYNVDYKILNTLDYGIPQNRKRLYILGTKKTNNNVSFTRPKFPDKFEMQNIEKFIDYDDNTPSEIPEYVKTHPNHINKTGYFIDLGFRKNKFRDSDKFIGTLTTTCYNKWCIPLERKINVKEALRFQGFKDTFIIKVSRTQILKQIGNSMSVNVLEQIFLNNLRILN